jgi:hypothetical protein
MPQIGGENGKPTLHVLSGTIPMDHGLNGKSVSKIMKAWTAIGWSMTQAGPSGEFIKCSSNCRHLKGTPEVGNQKCTALGNRKQRITVGCVPSQCADRGSMQRYEAGLAKLALPNAQDPVREINVIRPQSESFADTQAGNCQKAK